MYWIKSADKRINLSLAEEITVISPDEIDITMLSGKTYNITGNDIAKLALDERQEEIARTEAAMARQREKLESKEGALEQRLLQAANLLNKLRGNPGDLSPVQQVSLFQNHGAEIIELARLMG